MNLESKNYNLANEDCANQLPLSSPTSSPQENGKSKLAPSQLSLCQNVLRKKLKSYLAQRDLIKSYKIIEFKGGICYGLTILFAYYCFIDKEQDFFDRLRKCINIDVDSMKNLSFKSFKELSCDELELERMANDVSFLHSLNHRQLFQSDLCNSLLFVSNEIKNFKFTQTHRITDIQPSEDLNKSLDFIKEALLKITSSAINKKIFIQLNLSNIKIDHSIGFWINASYLLFYDSNIPNQVPPIEINNEISPRIENIANHIAKYYLSCKKHNIITFNIMQSSNEESLNFDIQQNNVFASTSIENEILFEKLMAAVWYGDLSEVSILVLETKINPNQLGIGGLTPLIQAVDQGYIEIIRILLENGADPNQTNSIGEFPLYRAAIRGDNDVITLLLNYGAKINTARKDNYTALHVASATAPSSTVELLIKSGAEISKCPDTFEHPLWFAASYGNDEVIDTLINYYTDLDETGKAYTTPLWVAACNGHYEVVKKLVEKGAKIDYVPPLMLQKTTPLWEAARYGYEEIVQLLLQHNANKNIPDVNGIKPIEIAIHNKHQEVVQMLQQE